MCQVFSRIVLVVVVSSLLSLQAAQPPAEMGEQIRVEFWKVGAFQQRRLIQQLIAVNEPFTIRTSFGATAVGRLRRTGETELHFQGEVSHAGMSASFDSPGKLQDGVFHADRIDGGPDAGGFQSIHAVFSLSHVKEIVPAGLGLGVSGEQNQVIVARGPPTEAQRPSDWFKSGLEQPDHLTADQETWLLFRSRQLDNYQLWIERTQRNQNSFVVHMRSRATAAGDDHFEVHGVNVGKLLVGTYEVRWVVNSGNGDEPPMDGNAAKPLELNSSFEVQEASSGNRQSSSNL